jgi:hypothetical protein
MTGVLSEGNHAISIAGDGQFLVDLAVVKIKNPGDWQQICWVMFEF